MIILLFAVFVCIALLDVPNLIKTKEWKYLAVFSIFFVIAFTMSFLLVIGVDIPSPMLAIQYFLKDVLNLHY